MVSQVIIDEQRREFGIPALLFPSPAPTLSMDLSKGLVQTYTLVSNVFVTEPRFPPLPGSQLTVIFNQDAVGSRSITWGVCFRNAPAWVAGAAGTRATAVFVYDGTCYQFIGGSTAFAVSGLALVPDTGAVNVNADAPTSVSNPAPTVGAASLSGVAPTVTNRAIVTRGPLVGSLTFASTAPQVSTILTPTVASLVIQGQIPTRTSP